MSKISIHYIKFIILVLFGILHFNTSAQKPNIIFYLADDQDLLDYGCYGNPNVSTPTVDKLAAEGMKFTNAYTAQAICAPSRSQLYTGNYPLRTGCFVNHKDSYIGLKSITHYLKEVGYDVILAGKSHVGPKSVYDWTAHFRDEPLPGIEPHDGIPLTEIKNYMDTVSNPYCMFVTSHYPHGPHPDPVNFTNDDVVVHPYMSGDENRAAYYESILMDEKMISEIVTKIDSDSKFDNTVFVYSSDHGRAGKYTVSEPGLRVPFVIRWPGKIVAGTTSDALIHFTDVMPTFLEIAGAEIPADIDGESFYPVLKGEQTTHHEYVYGISHKQNTQRTYIYPGRMIRGKKYKYIINTNAKEVYQNNLVNDPAVNVFIERGANWKPNKPHEELYDLEADPWEQNNLADDPAFSTIKQELATELNNWLIAQNDFILDYPAPVLWSNLHTLDIKSQYNNIPEDLERSLNNSDIYLHDPDGAPYTPRNLTISNETATSVELTWTPSVYSADVTGYHVYQNGDLVETVEGSSTQISNLTEGESYVFTVRAINEANKKSAFSNKACVNSDECDNARIEMIPNGKFESGIGPSWRHQARNGGEANYSEVTENLTTYSNKALKAEVINITSNGWEVSSLTDKLQVQIDKDYIVSFYGKKDGTGEAEVNLVFQSPNQFHSTKFNLTNDWEQYSQTFTASFRDPNNAALYDSNLQIRLWYLTAGTDYYIDNVSMILNEPVAVNDIEIQNEIESNSLAVYPVAGSNHCQIISDFRIETIEIFNVSGKKYKTIQPLNGEEVIFSTAGLPKGMLILRANNNEVCKFINEY